MTNLDLVTQYVGSDEAAEQLAEMLDGVQKLSEFFKAEYQDLNPNMDLVTIPVSIVKEILSGWNKLVA